MQKENEIVDSSLVANKGTQVALPITTSGLSEPVKQTLDFIDSFFADNYSNIQKVPLSYLIISKDGINAQLIFLKNQISKNESIDKPLADIIVQALDEFLKKNPENIPCDTLIYHKNLLTELLSGNLLLSKHAIREKLYYLNFNEEKFITYEYNRLQLAIENLQGKGEKIGTLKFEQKRINQFTVRINTIYSPVMPSLKEQMNGWINEEIKYLESGCFVEQLPDNGTIDDSKIDTTLSVAKLALLIRLLVIDKIIINRTVAPVLRVIAKIFTTLQKDDISFGSLETKYHAPDKATINAVKDMLFKWINILGRL